MKIPLVSKIQENREHKRFDIFSPIIIYRTRKMDESSSISTKTINISEDGLRFCAKEQFITDSTLDFEIRYSSSILLRANGMVVWSKHIKNDNSYLHGIKFIDIEQKSRIKLKKILDECNLINNVKPAVKFESQPYGMTCREMYGVDLSIGCQYQCLYCHFSRLKEKQNPQYAKQLVDISSIYTIEHFPSPIYLSPFSESFTEQARDLSHAFLEYLLPKGICFWILTKAIIPEKTLKLIKRYSKQVELCIGITNLSDERNNIIEKGCPTARERLESIPSLLLTGCRVGARMDPIFPKIDDNPEVLETTIKNLAQNGIKEIASSYLFITAARLKVLKKEPYLKQSLSLFTEKSPTTGGNAFTLPLDEKIIRYKRMADICANYEIKLFVCGCKELRLQKEDGYSLACR